MSRSRDIAAIINNGSLNSPTFTGTVTVPEPENLTDASSKNYVDTATASSGGYARTFLLAGM